MKGDRYLLRHKSGRVIANFVVENDEGCLMGKCYEEDDSERFIADVYCKADACTHWRFYIEPEHSDRNDTNTKIVNEPPKDDDVTEIDHERW